jgi:plastocyanin
LRKLKRTAALGALALVASLVQVGTASAAETFTVQLGLGVPKGFSARALAPREGTTATINIHKGDTVNLVGGANLLPVGQGPLAWKADYATDLDDPFAPFFSDPDADLTEPFPTDAPYKFGPAFIGAPAPCGDDATSQCVFDGSNSNPVTGTLAAGDRSGSDGNWFVRIDANPGQTIWAAPSFGPVNIKTTLRIQVVANNETATTQTAIDAAKAELTTLERDTARALDAKMRRTSTKHKTKSGTVVWDAFAGVDTQTIALLAMYPANLVIHKGDKVRWHFSALQVEDHTVTFPFGYAAGENGLANNGVVPVCDPDGDGGEGPDTFTVDFETFECADPTDELELDLTRELVSKSGDGKFPGGKEHSGVRGSNIPETPDTPPNDAPYDLKFTKKNLDGYKYACAIHGGFMKGFVTVKG